MTAATVTRHPRLDAASDEDLLARVAGGDRDALGELYRRHRGVVRGYVLTRIARGDDADDVVQETFLRAAKQAGQFRAGDGHRVPPWLCWQAGAQLREYGQRDRHPYLAAARAAREQARRPVTETAEQREATPLSEPVRAALGRLTPGERRAIQLRYIDGLNPDQAAEIVGLRKRSLHRRVADGRRKLAAELADLAPVARSPLQDLPRREAITRALTATADDVPAAAEWLRKQGVHASEANLYRYRQMIQAGEPLPGEQAKPRASMRLAYPAYTPPEHVTAVSSALERARAAGIDYRTRFGRLPTRREVMDAVGVSESTAMRALRPLKAESYTRHVATAAAGESTLAAAPTAGADRAGVEHDRSRPAVQDAAAVRHRVPGAYLHDVVRVRDAEQSQRPVTDPSTRHPVRGTGRSATSAAPPAPHADLGRAAAVDTYASTRTGTRPRDHARDALTQRARRRNAATDKSTDAADGADRSSRADMSISHARAAVAVLAAHRAVQAQRRQAAEHDHDDQVARWHADDQHRTHADARSDAEGMCFQ